MKNYKKIITVVLAVILTLSFYGCAFGRSSDDIKPHLISEEEREKTPIRKIDAVTGTRGFAADSVADQFDELNKMLYEGDKPDFEDAFDKVKITYEAAVKVLNEIILNSFDTFERLHAIHDWLVYNVEYDHELYDNAEFAQSSNSAFRPDGVFINGKAVCDGIAKAFSLMCGIEQIPCVRITGEYFDGGSLINHAWNKVNLDGVWYNVDATMDALYIAVTENKTVKILNHGYFLLSDKDFGDSLTGCHRESGLDEVNYDCLTTYEFHKNQALGIGDYTMEITNQEDLDAVFDAIKNSKRKIGKIELKLNFDYYDKSNLYLQNAYVEEIATAYSKIKDKDFAFNAAKNIYPYKRYPNGVFVFIIYK